MAQEVSAGDFARRLGASQHGEVQANLQAGRGMALYSDGQGNRIAITYGTRDADIVGLPPRLYGGGELEQFVSPPATVTARRSPVMSWEPVPQISRPRVAPSQTAYPEVLLSGRSSSHPRGDAEFITPGRVEPMPVQPQEPARQLSEGERWWVDNLR